LRKKEEGLVPTLHAIRPLTWRGGIPSLDPLSAVLCPRRAREGQWQGMELRRLSAEFLK